MTLCNRRRTRKDRRERRGASERIPRLPWRTVRNPHPPTRVLSEDQIEAIHDASLRVLRDLGMKVLSPKARALYEGAGASADDDTAMVRFDSDMIEEYVALAPPSYTIKARNPTKSLTFGGNVINFETWYESGALSAARRANAIWKKLLADYEPPPIDPGVDEALHGYVVKRKRAIEAGEVALEH